MRRLLLDTHTLLWWLADDPQLGPKARAVIADERNEIYVSAANAWEISIKKALGKLEAPDDLDRIVDEEGFERLAISFSDGEAAGRLQALHRDPFDRMLVTQAQANGLEVVTRDHIMGQYGVATIDAAQ